MAQAQSDEAKMNTFIDNLMNKMTLKEKLGQLNLPVTGDIVTGQAKSSDVASKIKRGEVGGLFNLKGVEKIKEVQKIAVEQSRLHIPLLFGMDVIHGYETVFPIPFSLSCSWDMEAIKRTAQIAAQNVRQMVSTGLSVLCSISAATHDGDVWQKEAVRTHTSVLASPKPW